MLLLDKHTLTYLLYLSGQQGKWWQIREH